MSNQQNDELIDAIIEASMEELDSPTLTPVERTRIISGLLDDIWWGPLNEDSQWINDNG